MTMVVCNCSPHALMSLKPKNILLVVFFYNPDGDELGRNQTGHGRNRTSAVAALKYDEQSDLYALKHGLFVLHVVGEDLFSLTEPKNRMVL